MAKAVRLDKYLADAGVGTRSEVKKLIQKGQVQLNGEVTKKPESKVVPDKDRILCLGEEIKASPEFVYYLLHKPAGYVSATEDTREKTVLELVPKDSRRTLFPVGRLDKDTEGLLLITDDGALAHELLSPKKHVDKTYYAVVRGKVTKEDGEKMEVGVDIGEDKPTLPAKLVILLAEPSPEGEQGEWRSEILLTIHEGKFHQVKRMMEAVGKEVTYLKRISMGPLSLGEDLQKGEYRTLTEDEVEALRNLKRM